MWWRLLKRCFQLSFQNTYSEFHLPPSAAPHVACFPPRGPRETSLHPPERAHLITLFSADSAPDPPPTPRLFAFFRRSIWDTFPFFWSSYYTRQASILHLQCSPTPALTSHSFLKCCERAEWSRRPARPRCCVSLCAGSAACTAWKVTWRWDRPAPPHSCSSQSKTR